jgi:transcriptional regulator with XRE-family HTH domain
MREASVSTTGKWISEWRKKHGLKGAELAKLLGIKASQLSQWETGGPLPLNDKVLLLADYLTRGPSPQHGSNEESLNVLDPMLVTPEREELVRMALLSHMSRPNQLHLRQYLAKMLSQQTADSPEGRSFVVRIMLGDRPGVLGVVGQSTAALGCNITSLTLDILHTVEGRLVIITLTAQREDDVPKNAEPFESTIQEFVFKALVNGLHVMDPLVFVSELDTKSAVQTNHEIHGAKVRRSAGSSRTGVDRAKPDKSRVRTDLNQPQRGSQTLNKSTDSGASPRK